MSAARGRARWSSLDMAASLVISAFWHLLVLAVLAMAVHPFTLPDVSRPISVELMPPLPTLEPPPPPVELNLRPREAADEPTPALRPLPPVLPKAAEVRPVAPPQPRPLLDVARPSQPELDNPLEIAPRSTGPKPLQSNRAAPRIPEAPPEPLALTAPATPALQPPLEVTRAAPAAKRPLEASRPAPSLPVPASEPSAESQTQSAVPPQAPSQVQVLTNDAVIKAPVEIRPRDRTPIAPRQTTPQLPEIPAGGSGGGLPPPGGAGQGGGTAAGGLRPYGDSVNGGFDAGALKGMRGRLGCLNPETYRLTAEERAACLQRLAEEARNAPRLGPDIPAAKQAEYERYTACHRAYNAAAIAPSGSASDGASLRGLGSNPSLKECGPGDR
jgi:hypothetical protein